MYIVGAHYTHIESLLMITIIVTVFYGSIWVVAKWLALPTLDRDVSGVVPAGGRIQLMSVGALLLRAFHYNPSIISIQLK